MTMADKRCRKFRNGKYLAFIVIMCFLIGYLVLMKVHTKDEYLRRIPDNISTGPVLALSAGPQLSPEIGEPLPRLPRIVHQLVWSDTLLYRNYLSIISVQKILQPYMIILHTKKTFKLRKTPFSYNDWGEKLASQVPMLQLEMFPLLDSLKQSPVNEAKCAYSVLTKSGGMYVNINTVVNDNLWVVANKDKWSDENIWTIRLNSCSTPETFTSIDKCCTIDKDIFPIDIMMTNSSLGILARTLFYGGPGLAFPKTSFPDIPKIVHYVWFGDSDIKYSQYLSFVSTQKFVKPSKIFIYIDTWERKSSINFDKVVATNNVEIVFYGSLATVYQNELRKDSLRGSSHASDIVRADILLRYGGIYLDWDVYWTKPVDDLLSQGYETIAAIDFMSDMSTRPEFPDTVNMGVVLARPGSQFISLWLDSFKTYRGKEHGTFHAVEHVYKIYEEHPDLLLLHPRLQIMCFELKCHPLWIDNYKDASKDNKFDFRRDVYSVHFTHPTPEAFTSQEAVRNTKGFFGDMARHISMESYPWH